MQYYIIDFDGTFTRVEALEELAKISLKKHKDREAIQKQIEEITDMGMEGRMPFSESLSKRLALLHANRSHLGQLVRVLKKKVTKSFARNKEFFRKYAKNIYIFSGGFREFIVPIVKDYGLLEKNVYANTFTFDNKGNITGYDNSSPMAQEEGKVMQLLDLNLQGDVYVIGDGYTDYQMKESGLVKKFFAFTENIERKVVMDRADHVVPSFDEFLYYNNLPMSLSYPKSRIKVLLLENINKRAVEIFREEGYQVEHLEVSLSQEELGVKIRDVSILGVRSKTQVTKDILQKARRLMAVGTFSIGTNHIDLDACAKKGVAVFNAPYSNTRSVVELVLGATIMLYRKAFDKSLGMHKGLWMKGAEGCHEVRGKLLGIIGYGNIGSQLGTVAEAIGMRVCYYDLDDKLSLGNAVRCSSMEQLLKMSDVVTLHVDGRDENRGLMSAKQLKMMKQGSYLVNMSRGFVVDIGALVQSLESGSLGGAAIDVFPNEPKSNDEPFESPLIGMDNVILTPHHGAGTLEAQQNIADFVPHKLIEFINTGSTVLSCNFPNVSLPALVNAHRLLHVHENVPGIMAKINNAIAGHGINILGQYLKTNENIGYVITDVSRKYDSKVIGSLKKVPNTIKFRLLK